MSSKHLKGFSTWSERWILTWWDSMPVSIHDCCLSGTMGLCISDCAWGHLEVKASCWRPWQSSLRTKSLGGGEETVRGQRSLHKEIPVMGDTEEWTNSSQTHAAQSEPVACSPGFCSRRTDLHTQSKLQVTGKAGTKKWFLESSPAMDTSPT